MACSSCSDNASSKSEASDTERESETVSLLSLLLKVHVKITFLLIDVHLLPGTELLNSSGSGVA